MNAPVARAGRAGQAATLCAVAACAYVGANVTHEAIGHGGTCLSLGGTAGAVTSAWLTSCSNVTPWGARAVYAAGTVANLLAGALALAPIALRAARGRPGPGWYALWLYAAVNLFSAGGYLVTSPIFGFGDWSAFLEGIPAGPAWRAGLIAAGVAVTVVSLRLLHRALTGCVGGEAAERRSRLRTLCFVPYLAGSALLCLSGFLNPAGAGAAFSIALSTFAGTSFLTVVPAIDPKTSPAPGDAELRIGTSPGWIAAGLAAAILAIAGLGPGLGPRRDSPPGAAPPAPVSSVATSSVPGAGLPVVESRGGPLLDWPRLVAVTFANDDPAVVDRVDQLLQGLESSAYWKVTSEYGVGSLRARLARSSESPAGTLDDEHVAQWVRKHAADLGLTEQDLPMLLYPSGVTIRHGVERSCREFRGYHASTPGSAPSRGRPYAVVARCRPWGGRDADIFDTLTATLTHELIEAVLDPFHDAAPAFAHVDPAHFGWELAASGGAPTDLCQFQPSPTVIPRDLPFRVARIWSNAAARRGDDPCVPVPAGERPFFAAVPVLPEKRPVRVPGATALADVVNVPVGEKRAVEVRLYVAGASPGAPPDPGPYTLSADDGAAERGSAQVLALTLDADRAVAGERRTLTIESLYASADRVYPFSITARKGDVAHAWVGLVTQAP